MDNSPIFPPVSEETEPMDDETFQRIMDRAGAIGQAALAAKPIHPNEMFWAAEYIRALLASHRSSAQRRQTPDTRPERGHLHCGCRTEVSRRRAVIGRIRARHGRPHMTPASPPVRETLPEIGAAVLRRVIAELKEFHPAVPPYYCEPIKNVCAHWVKKLFSILPPEQDHG